MGKFVIGEFTHESNCFLEQLTGEREFHQRSLLRGEAILDDQQGKRTVLGGFIDGLGKHGHEIIGSVCASALPSGPVKGSFFHQITQEIVDCVRECANLDGMLLSLHGAMSLEASEQIGDPEGVIVSRIRDAIGARTPLVVVFDLHSDTTDLLLEKTDLTLAFNEEPHRDAYDRGIEAVEMIEAILAQKIQPIAVRERVPMLLPAINMATDQGPMKTLHGLRKELENKAGVLDISIHAGYYGADQPEVGFSVVCTTDGDKELARKMARQVSNVAWDIRESFLVELVDITRAVDLALETPGPVALIDEADDPAGGGSCDSVAILSGMIAGGVTAGGVSTIKDTQVVHTMAQAGEGARISVSLGGKTDSLHGEPIRVDGEVVLIHRDPIPMDPWSGATCDAGIIGVLDVNGILVVVTEEKAITENIDIFEVLGYDVAKMQAVVFKGLGLHIRQALAGKIATFIPVDGIGVTHPNVKKLGPYQQIRRPIWPLDEYPRSAYQA